MVRVNALPKSLQSLAKDFLQSKIYESGHVSQLNTRIAHLRRDNRYLSRYRIRYHQRMEVIHRLSRHLLSFQNFRRNLNEYRRQRKEIDRLRERISIFSRTLRSIRKVRRDLMKDNQAVRRWYQAELTTNVSLRNENTGLRSELDSLKSQLEHHQSMIQTVLDETSKIEGQT